jgi:hypothetical protein
MKMYHPPYHWLLVTLILLAFLLTLSEAYGQTTDIASATFEGRPAMAGAQAGLGALAGPPQGGIGVQGNELAERSLRRNAPATLDDIERAHRNGIDVATAAKTDPYVHRDVAPPPDRSLAKEQRSAAHKVKRAAKRTITRARHGTSEIDSYAAAGGR